MESNVNILFYRENPEIFMNLDEMLLRKGLIFWSQLSQTVVIQHANNSEKDFIHHGKDLLSMNS